MPQALQTARPGHLTLVALILVIFYAALAADYLNDRFVMLPEAPDLLAKLPYDVLWAQVAWSLTVWLGLAGALFLAWRDDAAVLILFATAVTGLAAMIKVALALPLDTLTEMPLVALVPAAVVVPLLGWVYARRLKRAGVLY